MSAQPRHRDAQWSVRIGIIGSEAEFRSLCIRGALDVHRCDSILFGSKGNEFRDDRSSYSLLTKCFFVLATDVRAEQDELVPYTSMSRRVLWHRWNNSEERAGISWPRCRVRRRVKGRGGLLAGLNHVEARVGIGMMLRWIVIVFRGNKTKARAR